MGERVTTENAVGLLAVMDRCGSGRTNHADALRDLLDARDDLDAARATFGELFDCAGSERVSDLMRMAVQECRSERARFKARGEEMDRVEREHRDLARWKVVAALLLEACDYTTEDIRENSDGAREQAESIAAGVRERFAELERERDEARAVAGCLRWYDHGADLWILRAGHKEVSRFNWPVRAFGHATHHEAARAVCDALGLPFITAGLPGKERDDG